MTETSNRTTWQILTKVPKLTVYFWIIKIITTALGESTSDFLVNTISPYVAVVIGFVILCATLAWQFKTRHYEPAVYWLAALGVSVAGTMGADVVHVGFGVPYVLSALFYAIALALVFILWYRSEGTLSIHSVYTRKREAFYWGTVLLTFALGTAAGDLTAFTLHLGFFGSAILFMLIFCVPCFMYWKLKVNGILTFWFAYILTRPIGASFADWFGKPVTVGGVGLGDLVVSLVLGLMMIFFVVLVSRNRADLYSQKQ
ncbi:MAG: putative rane-anchored protein [Candidatus Saccharibacteria bacterium]|nr:putative rane-anchored protein [Candidatus Saccharibacteria bacterium]